MPKTIFLKNWQHYAKLMRLHQPTGIFLLLWPTYWALWLASDGYPKSSLVLIFTLGVLLMRSAGCVLNDIADHAIDQAVTRTKTRPLAQQKISLKTARSLAMLLLFTAANLLWCLNRLTLLLAVIAAFLTALYPYTKRIFGYPQCFLGITFSFNTIMAFAATLGYIPTAGWLLFIANACWVTAYDTQYAIADYIDDLSIGIHSTAITWGHARLTFIALLQGGFMGLMSVIGYQHHLRLTYWLALAIAMSIFGYQYYLIKYQKAPLQAFLTNQYVGGFIALGIGLEVYLGVV